MRLRLRIKSSFVFLSVITRLPSPYDESATDAHPLVKKSVFPTCGRIMRPILSGEAPRYRTSTVRSRSSVWISDEMESHLIVPDAGDADSGPDAWSATVRRAGSVARDAR